MPSFSSGRHRRREHLAVDTLSLCKRYKKSFPMHRFRACNAAKPFVQGGQVGSVSSPEGDLNSLRSEVDSSRVLLPSRENNLGNAPNGGASSVCSRARRISVPRHQMLPSPRYILDYHGFYVNFSQKESSTNLPMSVVRENPRTTHD